jgi:hypothetical protein
LLSEFEEYVNQLQRATALKAFNFCQDYASRKGEYDEIDEQVCLRDRKKLIEHRLTNLLP